MERNGGGARLTGFARTMRAFFDTPAGSVTYNVAGTVLAGSAIVGGLMVLYLGVGVATGDLGRVAGQTAPERYKWTGLLLSYAIVLGSLAYVVRNASDDNFILIAAIAGVAVWFGLPIALDLGIATVSTQASAQANPAVEFLRGRFVFAGIFLLLLAGVRACIYVADRLLAEHSDESLPLSNRDVIERVAKRPIAKNQKTKRGPTARCWEQPHCIDFIKEVCRPWKEQRTCWKLQSGCMCDARYLYEALKQDQTLGTPASEGFAADAEALGGLASERKLFCRDCRIYLEHQRRKFRVLSPLSLPITVVLVYALIPVCEAVYAGIVHLVGRIVSAMWLSEQREAVASRFVDDMSNQGVVYAGLVIFGLFLWSGVARFMEWLTLEAKV